MTPTERAELSMLWQEISNRKSVEVLGDGAQMLRNSNPGDNLPQPGFVGAKYRSGSVLFIAMNPGGKGLSAETAQVHQVIEQLQCASAGSLLDAFEALNGVHRIVVPNWKIFVNFVRPILDCTGLTIDDIAYINLLKWRTRSGVKPREFQRLYESSWQAYTQRQVAKLIPGAVVAIGSDAGKAFAKLCPHHPYLSSIPRAIGNNVRPETTSAIALACSHIKNHLFHTM
jgi:hypothetical protein